MSNNILLRSIGRTPLNTLEQFMGSNCTGSDGGVNRVLTTSDISSALGETIIVVDGQFLRKTNQFSVSTDDITFLINIWDEQKIDIIYIK